MTDIGAVVKKTDVYCAADIFIELIVPGDTGLRFGQVEQLIDGYFLDGGGSAPIFASQFRTEVTGGGGGLSEGARSYGGRVTGEAGTRGGILPGGQHLRAAFARVVGWAMNPRRRGFPSNFLPMLARQIRKPPEPSDRSDISAGHFRAAISRKFASEAIYLCIWGGL